MIHKQTHFLLCIGILLLRLAIKHSVDLTLLSKLKYCSVLGFVPEYLNR